jgi:hypothetical protein
VTILGRSVEDHIDGCLCREVIDPRRLRRQNQASRIHTEDTDES